MTYWKNGAGETCLLSAARGRLSALADKGSRAPLCAREDLSGVAAGRAHARRERAELLSGAEARGGVARGERV